MPAGGARPRGEERRLQRQGGYGEPTLGDCQPSVVPGEDGGSVPEARQPGAANQESPGDLGGENTM